MKHLFKLMMACTFAFAALSCQKETDSPDKADPREIVFSATAGAETPQSKVTYSGVLEGGYERIQWESNDRIRIHCPEAGNSLYKASYTVAGEQHTEGSRISRAWNVYATTSDKLMWKDNSTTHHFYAKYPDPTWNKSPGPYGTSNDFKNQETALSSAPQDFIGYIPATQTLIGSGYTRTPEMGYMFMTAYAEGKMGDDINFNFEPAVTAFEFTVSNNYFNQDFVITRAELVSESHTLNGKFKVTITDADHLHNAPVIYGDPATAANRKITVNFSNFTVPQYQNLVFTIFAVPQTLNDLTLRLVLNDNTERTLELKKEVLGTPEWVSFAPFKKYRIDCGSVGDPWSYSVSTNKTQVDFACVRGNSEQQQVLVTSFREKNGASRSATPWYLEWSEDGTNWYGNGLPSQVSSISPFDGVGSTGSETVSITMKGGTRRFQETPSGGYTSFTFQDTPAGNSESTPTDLSRWDFMNQVASDYETANCYVIRAKGWYTFPLIYGDASLGSKTYSNQTGQASSSSITANFYSGTGIITKPEIENAKSVSIVWQDCKASVISGLQLVDTNDDGINDLVKFQVTENITPCNILLKVCDGSGTCIWTWHLWIVPNELDLKTIFRYNSWNNPTLSTRLLNVNLGAIPCTGEGSVVERMYYDDYTFYLRFRARWDDSVISDVITCQRREFESGTALKKLLNPHYQWGRKEPMLTPKWDADKADMVERGTDDYSGSWGTVAGPKYFEEGMRVPDKQITGNLWGSIASTGYYSYTPYNLWATNCHYGNMSGTYTFIPIKSVYDPCPRGFCVSRSADFDGMGSSSSTSTNSINGGGDGGWQDGFYVSTYVDYGTMFFPYTGYRTSDGTLTNQYSSSTYKKYSSYYLDTSYATYPSSSTDGYGFAYSDSNWWSPNYYYSGACAMSIRPLQMTWNYKD